MMVISVQELDQQRIRQLNQEHSEDPSLDSALGDFRIGNTAYAVYDMLSAFKGFYPRLRRGCKTDIRFLV